MCVCVCVCVCVEVSMGALKQWCGHCWGVPLLFDVPVLGGMLAVAEC